MSEIVAHTTKAFNLHCCSIVMFFYFLNVS